MNFKIRNAQSEDSIFFYDLRNNENIRMNSFNKDLIPYEEHNKWFEQKLKDKNTKLFVIEVENEGVFEKAGQIRFDIEGEDAIVSISIMPEYQGKAIGSNALKKACNEILVHENLKKIIAYILIENQASLKAFEKAGFKFSRKTIVKNNECFEFVLEK